MDSFHSKNYESNFLYSTEIQDAKSRFSRIALSLVLCTFVTYLSILILELILALLGLYPRITKNIYYQWAISLGPLYLFGIPSAYLFMRKIRPISPKKHKMDVGEILLFFLIGRFFTFVGSYISNVLLSLAEKFFERGIANDTGDLITETPTWLVFVTAVVLGPIIEEIVYRKLIIDRLYVHGEMVAILFSSVVFSLVHGNLFQVFYAFLNGCILGLIYTRTGRLRYTIALHMSTNFLGTIAVLPIMEAQEKLEAFFEAANFGAQYAFLTLTITGYSIAKIFIALLGAAIFFMNYRKYLPNRRAIHPLPVGQGFRIAALNPGVIVFVAVCIWEFALSLF